MALNIKDDNFEAIVAEGKPVVLDFWATWCGPCKQIAPYIEELAEEYKDKVNIGKCDVDENGDVAAENGIRKMQTFLHSLVCATFLPYCLSRTEKLWTNK